VSLPAHRTSARIHDKVARRQHGFDLIEADRAGYAAADEASRRRRQRATGADYLGDQGRDARGERGRIGAIQRGRGVCRPNPAQRKLGAGELRARHQRRRRSGVSNIDSGECPFGGFDVADEELTAYPDQARVKGIGAIAECIEHLCNGVEAVTGPNGLFGQLEAQGFKVFPGNDVPPRGNTEDARLNGGYTVYNYGGEDPRGIDAMQLEFGSTYQRKAVLDKSAQAAARAIAAFYGAYLKPPASR
jgi:hypothetical protein